MDLFIVLSVVVIMCMIFWVTVNHTDDFFNGTDSSDASDGID